MIFVNIVLTLTRIVKSVFIGQAPVTLAEEYPRGKTMLVPLLVCVFALGCYSTPEWLEPVL